MNRRESRNQALDNGVMELVEIEKTYAAAEHGPYYHSPAEGYQIIREEALETTTETDRIMADLAQLDTAIRAKDDPKQLTRWAERLRIDAMSAAVEAIHLAAAAAKLIRSIEDEATRYFTSERTDE